MSTTDFDPDWPHGHVTRDGRKVRIICRDRESKNILYGPRPIVALVMVEDGQEIVVSYRADGSLSDDNLGGDDILNAPAPKPRIKGWLNIYDAGEVILLLTRSEADLQARTWTCRRRVACIPIDIEEGEGL